MKVFVASIATETNTFAALPTGLGHDEEAGLYRAGEPLQAMGAWMKPLAACLQELAANEGHELAFGLCAAAQPLGRTVRAVWEALRDELLSQPIALRYCTNPLLSAMRS